MRQPTPTARQAANPHLLDDRRDNFADDNLVGFMPTISTTQDAIHALRALPAHIISRAAQTTVEADGQWKATFQAAAPRYGRPGNATLENVSAWVRDADVLVSATVQPEFSNIQPMQLHIAIAESALIELAMSASALADVQPSFVITGARVALGERPAAAQSTPGRGGRGDVQWENA